MSYDAFDRLMSGFLGVIFLTLAAAALWFMDGNETIRAAVFLVSSVMSVVNLKEAITGK